MICGLPFYAIDHMVDYAKVKTHDVSNLTLLCPGHHDDKTHKRLPLAQVLKANADPINVRLGRSKMPQKFFFAGNSCKLVLGNALEITLDTSTGASRVAPIVIDRLPFIDFEIIDGALAVSINAFDSRNRTLLLMRRNEIIVTTVSWDVESTAARLILRTAARQVVLDIEFRPPNEVYFRRGHIFRNGVEIIVREQYVVVVNTANVFSGFTLQNGGIEIGPPSGLPMIFGIPDKKVPRFGIDRNGVDRKAIMLRTVAQMKRLPKLTAAVK